eukprot:gene3629-975_t
MAAAAAAGPRRGGAGGAARFAIGEKPETDPRSYRGLVLANGVRVAL